MIGGPHRRRRRADDGETLIEILISLAIMGVVMVGLIAGLTTVIIGSDAHRHLSDVEVVARQYGEALVDQAYHPATATLATDNCTSASVCSTSLAVKNVTGTFPVAPFYVAIDAEVLKVTSTGTGTNWTLDAAPTDTHLSGATVTYDALYDACKNPANIRPAYTVPSGAKFIGPPTIGSPDFFDTSGSPVADCAGYWQTTQPCAGFSPIEHLTSCDPALLRVAITVSTTSSSPQQSSATTSVLVRRGDA